MTSIPPSSNEQNPPPYSSPHPRADALPTANPHYVNSHSGQQKSSQANAYSNSTGQQDQPYNQLLANFIPQDFSPQGHSTAYDQRITNPIPNNPPNQSQSSQPVPQPNAYSHNSSNSGAGTTQPARGSYTYNPTTFQPPPPASDQAPQPTVNQVPTRPQSASSYDDDDDKKEGHHFMNTINSGLEMIEHVVNIKEGLGGHGGSGHGHASGHESRHEHGHGSGHHIGGKH